MSDLTQIDLKVFSDSASRLAGRPVAIRSRTPFSCGRAGQAMMALDNIHALIDLDPGIHNPGDLMRVFCHECAHVRLHWKSLPFGKENLPPNSIDEQEAHKLRLALDPALKAEEAAADELAATWLAYADKNYPRYGNKSMQRIERRLLALSDWSVSMISEKVIYDLVQVDDKTIRAVLR
jgi:hypothetical protein